MNPLTADDPARVADYGALPGESLWNAKQLDAYERRIEKLEEELFKVARTDILRCIRGESECVVLLFCEGLRSASRSDLLDALNDQTTIEEGLSLWGVPSDEADQTKKRIIDALAWDVAKARAETFN
jgi:hypothetical protein